MQLSAPLTVDVASVTAAPQTLVQGKAAASQITRDTTAPTVSLTPPTPVNGATVSGTVTLSATASDNVGVARVEFLVDGGLLAADPSSPYGVSWNTTAVSNGTHTVAARALDAANNATTTSTVTVTVNNPISRAPAVSLPLPPTVRPCRAR